MDLNQVTLPALDVGESAEFFKRMGFLQIVDSPHYARFECPDGEQKPADRSWLWREAILIDPAGNRICLYRAGENRKYPPWRTG
jgi:hypothetical protein